MTAQLIVPENNKAKKEFILFRWAKKLRRRKDKGKDNGKDDTSPILKPQQPTSRTPRPLSRAEKKRSRSVKKLISELNSGPVRKLKHEESQWQQRTMKGNHVMHEDSIEAILLAARQASSQDVTAALESACDASSVDEGLQQLPAPRIRTMCKENLSYFSRQPFSLGEKITRWSAVTDFINPQPPPSHVKKSKRNHDPENALNSLHGSSESGIALSESPPYSSLHKHEKSQPLVHNTTANKLSTIHSVR